MHCSCYYLLLLEDCVSFFAPRCTVMYLKYNHNVMLCASIIYNNKWLSSTTSRVQAILIQILPTYPQSLTLFDSGFWLVRSRRNCNDAVLSL